MTIFIDILILALVTLFFFTTRLTKDSSDFMALFLIAIASFFVFKYLFFFEIDRKRAFLDFNIKDESEIKKKLWNSPFVILKVSLISIILAFSIIFTIAKIDTAEAAFIFGSILTFKLIYTILSKITYKHFKPSTSKQNTLRIAYYLNLLIVVVALSSYQYYNKTYELKNKETTQEIKKINENIVNNKIVPIIFQIIENIENKIISALKEITFSDLSISDKVSIWFLYLILNAIKIFLFWLVLLGTQTIINEQKQNGWKSLGNSSFSKQFTISLILLFGLYLVLQKIIDINSKSQNTINKSVVETEIKIKSTCNIEKENNELLISQHKINSQAALSKKYAELESIVDHNIEELNLSLEKDVDTFLNWHFSVLGQYTQLLFLAGKTVYPEKLESLFSEKIYDPLMNNIYEKNKYLNLQLNDSTQSFINDYNKSQDTYIKQLSVSNECYPDTDFDSSYNLNESTMLVDETIMKIGGGAAAVVGLKLSSQAYAKVLAAKIATKLSTSTIAKLVAKASISGTAAASAVTCGPAAPACAFGLALGTWFVVDAAAVTVEEQVSREKFKAEIMEDIYEHTAKLGIETKARYADMLVRGIQEVDSAKLGKFLQPAQDINRGK